MAIKVNGTTVINDSRALSNIASVDATTAAAILAAGVGGNPYTAQSKSSSGYISLVGGVIIQWGKSGSIGTGSSASVTFATAFPNACTSVVSSADLASGSNSFGWSSGSPSTTGVTFYSNGAVASSGMFYIAIGY